MTISDAFAAAVPAADVVGSHDSGVGRMPGHARMRARGYRSLPVLDKIRDRWAVAVEDLRSAWFMPASVPTVQDAWATRLPDRDRVPGSNGALYAGWLVYNHTVALAVPALAVAVVGVLTPVVWAAAHPARFLLLAAFTSVAAVLTLI